jgi:hypothetical protein
MAVTRKQYKKGKNKKQNNKQKRKTLAKRKQRGGDKIPLTQLSDDKKNVEYIYNTIPALETTSSEPINKPELVKEPTTSYFHPKYYYKVDLSEPDGKPISYEYLGKYNGRKGNEHQFANKTVTTSPSIRFLKTDLTKEPTNTDELPAILQTLSKSMQQRGEKLEELSKNSEQLETGAHKFKDNSALLAKKMREKKWFGGDNFYNTDEERIKSLNDTIYPKYLKSRVEACNNDEKCEKDKAEFYGKLIFASLLLLARSKSRDILTQDASSYIDNLTGESKTLANNCKRFIDRFYHDKERRIFKRKSRQLEYRKKFINDTIKYEKQRIGETGNKFDENTSQKMDKLLKYLREDHGNQII